MLASGAEVVNVTGYSNGNSFGTSLGESAGNAVGAGAVRWPVPAWKFGLRQSDDRGGM
jgi:hypothetical protein